MIPKLIDSVCHLVISGDEMVIITMISRYFQVWSNIDEKLQLNFLQLFFLKLIPLDLPGIQFFFR